MNLIVHITNDVKTVYILKGTKSTYRVKYLWLQCYISLISVSKHIDNISLKAVIKYTFKYFYLFCFVFSYKEECSVQVDISQTVSFITSAFLTFCTRNDF